MQKCGHDTGTRPQIHHGINPEADNQVDDQSDKYRPFNATSKGDLTSSSWQICR
jgi:hypothetical protein